MSTFDFSGLSNTTAWSDASFAQDTTNFNQGQLVSQTANGSLHAVCSPTSGTGIVRAKLVGRTWGTTISSKVTVNGIRGFSVTDDSINVLIVVETGANAWKGYTWACGNGLQRLGMLNSATDDDISDLPNAAIAAPTSDTVTEGDTFELSLNTSTGVLIGKHNGTQITTATDTTYATGLTAGFEVKAANHGGTGVSRLDTTGDAPGLSASPAAGTAATGAIVPPAYAPIPLDQAGIDQIFLGTQPNDGTGTPGRIAMGFVKNWAVKLNVMLQQLYGAASYQQPTSGFTIVVPVGVSELLLDPAGTLASGTITMPANALDRQPFTVATSQTITALTVNPASGQNLNGAPTTLAANSSLAWRYRAENNTWYRWA